jgi:hypothetical protein
LFKLLAISFARIAYLCLPVQSSAYEVLNPNLILREIS